MAAKDAGVDITNEKEMRKFIALYNTCGSGKKYKKCCGR